MRAPARRGTISQVAGRPASAQYPCDFARVRRVRDRIDQSDAQPLDAEALARGAHRSSAEPPAIEPEVKRLGLVRPTEVLRNG